MSFDYKRLIKFEHNVGAKEAQIRMIAGAVSFGVSIFTASILLLAAGIVLLATGYSGWCPAYSGMNKSTLSPEEFEKTPSSASE